MTDHVPAEPETIGGATGLVYCMACGYLLSSDRTGPRPRAEQPCTPNRVSLR